MKTNENLIKTSIISRKPKEDLTGIILGKLLVIERDMSRIGQGIGSYWICKCDCGKTASISKNSLGKGTKSCGCLQKEVAINKALPNAGSNKKYWLNKYKARSKQNNVPFTLTDEQFYDICSKSCFYCDAQPSPKSHGYKTKKDVGEYLANGIDRIDPILGYILENSVPCCKTCNFMKTNKNQKDFIDKIFQIADHIRGK